MGCDHRLWHRVGRVPLAACPPVLRPKHLKPNKDNFSDATKNGHTQSHAHAPNPHYSSRKSMPWAMPGRTLAGGGGVLVQWPPSPPRFRGK